MMAFSQERQPCGPMLFSGPVQPSTQLSWQGGGPPLASVQRQQVRAQVVAGRRQRQAGQRDAQQRVADHEQLAGRRRRPVIAVT